MEDEQIREFHEKLSERIALLEDKNDKLLEASRRVEGEKRYVESELLRLQKEVKRLRAELDRLKTPPLIIGNVRDILADGRVVVKSSTGPDFIVNIAEYVAKESVSAGARVALKALRSGRPLRTLRTLQSLWTRRSLETVAVQHVDDEVAVPVLRRRIAHAVGVQVPTTETVGSIGSRGPCGPRRSVRSLRPRDARGSRDRGRQYEGDSSERYRHDAQRLLHASSPGRG